MHVRPLFRSHKVAIQRRAAAGRLRRHGAQRPVVSTCSYGGGHRRADAPKVKDCWSELSGASARVNMLRR